MTEIYLDFNIYLSILKNEKNSAYTLSKIINLRKKGIIFPYSPAHIEELSVNNNTENINILFRLNLIKKISQCYEYLPGIPDLIYLNQMIHNYSNNTSYKNIVDEWKRLRELHYMGKVLDKELKTKIKKEEPIKCFKRVNNKMDWTDLALKNHISTLGRRNKESLERNFTEKEIIENNIISSESLQKKYKLGANRIKHIGYKDIFKNENFILLLKDRLKEINLDINNIKKSNYLHKNHSYKEMIIPILLNTLEIAGYYQEKGNKNRVLRSQMHDSTHAIYGSKADYFITADNRFKEKLKAVLYFLNINCKILDIKDFLDLNFENNKKIIKL